MMALDIQRAPAVHVLCEYSICVKISVSHLKALLLISLSCSNVIFSNSWCFFTLLVALKRRLSKYYESLTVNKKAITSRHQFVIFFFFFISFNSEERRRKYLRALPSEDLSWYVMDDMHKHISTAAPPVLYSCHHYTTPPKVSVQHLFVWPFGVQVNMQCIPASFSLCIQNGGEIAGRPPKCMFTCRCCDRTS